ncbi:hypothetical protein [Vibrio sp. M250220]|uniref:hypothetical protein n=1 Tax=Vibrio sp. M250220 TaxID=3020894 RepID=UPI002F3E9043
MWRGQHKAKIAEGVDPKEERDGYKRTPTVKEFFWGTFLPLAKKKKTWKDDVARFNRHCQSVYDKHVGKKIKSQLYPINLKMQA